MLYKTQTCLSGENAEAYNIPVIALQQNVFLYLTQSMHVVHILYNNDKICKTTEALSIWYELDLWIV